MGNNATDITSQINLLETRGMILDLPEEKIKEHLLDIGIIALVFIGIRLKKAITMRLKNKPNSQML